MPRTLIFHKPARSFTGNFLIDDTFLYADGGVTDFEGYRVDRSVPLAPDFFVPADSVPPPGVTIGAGVDADVGQDLADLEVEQFATVFDLDRAGRRSDVQSPRDRILTEVYDRSVPVG